MEFGVPQGRRLAFFVDVPATELTAGSVEGAKELRGGMENGGKVVVDESGDVPCERVIQEVAGIYTTGSRSGLRSKG